MPIYEYQCNNCNAKLERLEKMSATPAQDCPDCQQPTLQRLISASRFKLKGTGWYVTDFKNADKAPAPATPTNAMQNVADNKEQHQQQHPGHQGDKAATNDASKQNVDKASSATTATANEAATNASQTTTSTNKASSTASTTSTNRESESTQ